MKAQPTGQQCRLFCEMIHLALVEIRGLGNQGKSEQAAALADAFHNLPISIFQPLFDWKMSRSYFQSYHAQYPFEASAMPVNYVAMHDRIQAAV